MSTTSSSSIRESNANADSVAAMAVIDTDARHYLLNAIISIGTALLFLYIPARWHGNTYYLQDKGAGLAFFGLAMVFSVMGLVKARRVRLAKERTGISQSARG